ncbi:hypothetical protein HPB51_016420 [Rhipicephalus microplus]|uniref:Uncharacterized protein n=1 Tax=Rhipicephalus microplus TaxID=6941 RepID=A0A9J6EAK2_RHIMP|nr:hypothetical protein HPB51_016420 [Rhipicephalus microplus]
MVLSLEHTFRAGTPWMQNGEITNVIKRLKSLQVGYLAGQEREEEVEHYYASVKATDASLDNPVSYYSELLSKSLRKYWKSSADGANYDARFSERLTDLDVAWTRSPESALKVYLTSSTVAAASLVTRSNYPSTLFSLLAADVARALFMASLDNPQWSSLTRDRFQAIQYCLLSRYKHGVRAANASAANVRNFLADILADNAVLKPLIAAFRRFLAWRIIRARSQVCRPYCRQAVLYQLRGWFLCPQSRGGASAEAAALPTGPSSADSRQSSASRT